MSTLERGGYAAGEQTVSELPPIPGKTPVTGLPPIVQEFRADTRHFQRAAEIMARHLGALAQELAELEEEASLPFGPLSPIQPVPVDGPGAPRPEPRKFPHPTVFAAPGGGQPCQPS